VFELSPPSPPPSLKFVRPCAIPALAASKTLPKPAKQFGVAGKPQAIEKHDRKRGVVGRPIICSALADCRRSRKYGWFIGRLPSSQESHARQRRLAELMASHAVPGAVLSLRLDQVAGRPVDGLSHAIVCHGAYCEPAGDQAGEHGHQENAHMKPTTALNEAVDDLIAS